MKMSLIQYLVCPTCRRPTTIKIHKKIKDEIISGKILCTHCNEDFIIKGGIPRFVTDQTKDFVRTEEAFSAKWRTHHKNHQAKDWILFQQKWFLERFGWKTLGNFTKFLKTKNKILDAGTGIGNSAKLLSANPNAQVFALDASESIDFAYKKYGNIKNIHFLQADLRQLPFAKKFFDYVYSDQVLHHTKNTATSFKYLTKFLQKDGHISIYVYNKKAPVREYVDDFIRKKTVKMSISECVEFSKDMAVLGKSLSKLKKKITIPRNIPLLGVKAGTYDVQRFVYWHFLKCFWDENDDFERSVGVNFDWYYPKFAFRHTPNEVKKWFKDTKIRINHFKEIESGISVTGKK
ncbi:MAG: methyltransferase domain-containing protein [Crenarchaeota archaeon]|nr:MAG: methyltransferase domain-containing protein [Thermoproteota archaeon]RDJ33356.1 MAG: methyltransferase domain-containing protein [Thermoproteota archaeon]RDJ36140.1 MAG: methyltransferase domain-containing protein [Thermoproteota archaeon]RDJ38772.1 MAG: methyltransferase domain-containing protein [Thermoproteota archaeon]